MPFTWPLVRRILRHRGPEGNAVLTVKTERAFSDDRQSDITELSPVHFHTVGPKIQNVTHYRRYDSYADDKSYANLLGRDDPHVWRKIEYEGQIARSPFERRDTDPEIDLEGHKIEMLEFLATDFPAPHRKMEGSKHILFGREK